MCSLSIDQCLEETIVTLADDCPYCIAILRWYRESKDNICRTLEDSDAKYICTKKIISDANKIFDEEKRMRNDQIKETLDNSLDSEISTRCEKLDWRSKDSTNEIGRRWKYLVRDKFCTWTTLCYYYATMLYQVSLKIKFRSLKMKI